MTPTFERDSTTKNRLVISNKIPKHSLISFKADFA